MSGEEKKVFIQDPRENMTTREKNMHLSAKLAVAPNANRKIERIDRIENGGSGWQIHYHTG
ncbi:MAG: hypothetical protein PVJ11_05755 [Syntrophobacterales bacterium]|jgi:hypothetical protein